MPRAAISLDPRLEKIAELCGDCVSLADIGTDHGRLGAYMLQTGMCASVQFTDISEQSLMKAKRLLATLGLVEKARFLTGDGAAALEHAPGAAVIAGMGGETIAGIIARGREYLADARLILQPNLDCETVRRQLCLSGYRITDEAIVKDGRRLYVIIAAEPGEMKLDEFSEAVGPVIMKKRPALLSDYAAFRLRVAKKALEGAERGGVSAEGKRRELEIWEEVASWQRQG